MCKAYKMASLTAGNSNRACVGSPSDEFVSNKGSRVTKIRPIGVYIMVSSRAISSMGHFKKRRKGRRWTYGLHIFLNLERYLATL